jgi:hypothetical protein
MYAILSSSVILTPGLYRCERISLIEAKEWIAKRNPIVYSTHETVRVLDVEPSHRRLACNYYDEALCVKPRRRLDAFGKQYTKDEIIKIGVDIFLITREGD